METNLLTPAKLFKKDVQYEIPVYQRPYVWTKEEQWVPLWNDLKAASEAQLKMPAGSEAKPHFLGAVVLQQKPSTAVEPSKVEVVDGQQRLTTLQLVLDAGEEVFDELKLDVAKFLHKLVENDEDFWDDDNRHRFKVWPTRHDRSAFEAVMANEKDASSFLESKLSRAHQFFYQQIHAWLTANGDGVADMEARANALLEVLNSGVVVVAIEVTGEDDANLIFETLNARGTPLRAWDLSKNFLLNEGTENLNSETLTDLDSEWWQEEVGSGLNKRARVDDLLTQYTTMRRRIQVATRTSRDIYSAFREYAMRVEEGAVEKSIDGVATDLRRVSDVYRDIFDDDLDPEHGRFLERWRTIPVGSFHPVVMWLLAEGVRGKQLSLAFAALESYFTRRMVCGLTAGGGGDFLQSTLELLDALSESGPATAGNAVLHHFSELYDPDARLRWPDNAEVRRRLIDEFPMYDKLSGARVRLVLEALEESMMSKRTESGVPGHLSIEHVLPRVAKQADYPLLTSGLRDNESPEETRARLIHTIGNLTLVTQKLNSTASNLPFKEKKRFLKESRLSLNASLVRRQRWDENRIRERSRKLADEVIKVWPNPAKLRSKYPSET